MMRQPITSDVASIEPFSRIVPAFAANRALGPDLSDHYQVGRKEPSEKAAYRLVEALVDAGVDTFFGLPGGPIMPLFDAILRHAKVRLIESRQETNAAFAAAGYYR